MKEPTRFNKDETAHFEFTCPFHKDIKLIPILTSDHYRCRSCFYENEGTHCEYSGYELILNVKA